SSLTLHRAPLYLLSFPTRRSSDLFCSSANFNSPDAITVSFTSCSSKAVVLIWSVLPEDFSFHTLIPINTPITITKNTAISHFFFILYTCHSGEESANHVK